MTASQLRVAVIRGGNSSEREVSLKSGQAVMQALNPRR
jgi:D-alanine-D-alanine ligase-like ATP-grasp enzyme